MGWFTAALIDIESHGTLCRFKNILKKNKKLIYPDQAIKK
jgi:hypothetical protein